MTKRDPREIAEAALDAVVGGAGGIETITFGIGRTEASSKQQHKPAFVAKPIDR